MSVVDRITTSCRLSTGGHCDRSVGLDTMSGKARLMTIGQRGRCGGDTE